MTSVVFVGEYWGANGQAVRQLTEALTVYLSDAQRSFAKASTFAELAICIRCQPKANFRPNVRLRKQSGGATLGAEVWLECELAKKAASANAPLVGAAMQRVFSALRAYYKRRRLPSEEVDALEQDFWSAFTLPSSRRRASASAA